MKRRVFGRQWKVSTLRLVAVLLLVSAPQASLAQAPTPTGDDYQAPGTILQCARSPRPTVIFPGPEASPELNADQLLTQHLLKMAEMELRRHHVAVALENEAHRLRSQAVERPLDSPAPVLERAGRYLPLDCVHRHAVRWLPAVAGSERQLEVDSALLQALSPADLATIWYRFAVESLWQLHGRRDPYFRILAVGDPQWNSALIGSWTPELLWPTLVLATGSRVEALDESSIRMSEVRLAFRLPRTFWRGTLEPFFHELPATEASELVGAWEIQGLCHS